MPDGRDPSVPPAAVEVLVLGGGIAAYCAALAARETGAEVALIDRAPPCRRGGNARHSRNLRLAHEAPTRLIPGSYRPDEFVEDLHRASGGTGDPELGHLLAERSCALPAWLAAQGVRFEEPAGGTIPWSRKTAFLLGGGKAMVNALAHRAARLGIAIHQDVRAEGLSLASGSPYRVPLRLRGRPAPIPPEIPTEITSEIEAQALVLACGGYQANLAWLGETWGPAATGFIVRGLPEADGELLRALLDQGAAEAGAPGACHLVAVDARSPPADGGIVTRVDGLSWGLVVDETGRRFHDEGAELGPRRYSSWGRLLTNCPGQRAFLILDGAGRRRTMPSIYPPIEAATIGGLAAALRLDPQRLERTLADYNRAVRPGGPGDPSGPDADHTIGLAPAKSRRALPLVAPPFAAYPLAPGISFTSHGVRVDRKARVRRRDGAPSWPALYAAGAIMAPAILGTGYLAATGLTIGAVFGRIAGEEAARHVRTGR